MQGTVATNPPPKGKRTSQGSTLSSCSAEELSHERLFSTTWRHGLVTLVGLSIIVPRPTNVTRPNWELLKLCLRSTYFSYNGEFYEQLGRGHDGLTGVCCSIWPSVQHLYYQVCGSGTWTTSAALSCRGLPSCYLSISTRSDHQSNSPWSWKKTDPYLSST